MAMDMKAFDKVAGRINPGMTTDYTADIVKELRALWESHVCPTAEAPVVPFEAPKTEAPKAPGRHEPKSAQDIHDQTEAEARALADLGE